MTTAETPQSGLRRLRKFTANPLKSLCEDVLRRLRRFIAKSLIFLAKVCEAKVPHTPYALRARQKARCASGEEGPTAARRPRAGRPVAAWPVPRCPVCRARIGRKVMLDVLDARRGGRFRLCCRKIDESHNFGVEESYRLSAAGNPDAQLRNIAELDWVDPRHLASAAMPWLLAHCRFVGREP